MGWLMLVTLSGGALALVTWLIVLILHHASWPRRFSPDPTGVPAIPQERERNLMRAQKILRFVAALPCLISNHQDYGTTDRVVARCQPRLTEPWLQRWHGRDRR
jgi:hypothetical protein